MSAIAACATSPGAPVSTDGVAVMEKFWTTRTAWVECEAVPLLTVMVSGYVPPTTVAGTVTTNETEPDALRLDGVNTPVAPEGRPATEKLNGPVAPLAAERVRPKVPLVPTSTGGGVEETEMVKSGVMTSVAPMLLWSEPLVPTIVNGYEPGARVAKAFTVIVELPAALRLAGANVAVASAGRPVAVRATGELNPPSRASDTTPFTLPPVPVDRVGGAIPTVNPRTARLTVVVCVVDPLVPEMLRVKTPPATLGVEEIVSVVEPVPLSDAGENTPVAPVGSPLTENEVEPLRPLMAARFTVYVVPVPGSMVWDAGKAESEKLEVMAMEVWKVCCAPPLVAVIVNG